MEGAGRGAVTWGSCSPVVPFGDWSAFALIGELDLPFAGVLIAEQDGAVVSQNRVEIRPNTGASRAVGPGLLELTIGAAEEDHLAERRGRAAHRPRSSLREAWTGPRANAAERRRRRSARPYHGPTGR